MPRTARAAVGDVCYHVLNRGNGGRTIFRSDGDYRAFLRLIAEATERVAMRILAFCLMPTHFHFVLWPRDDEDLSRWMHWLMTTHVGRYREVHETIGHVWQGRFKAFPIQQDDHLLTVLRYVERNALNAGLTDRAERWPWSSLDPDAARKILLTSPPVPRTRDWLAFVNEPLTERERGDFSTSLRTGRPFGAPEWVRATATKLGLESTLRSRGRPPKGLSPIRIHPDEGATVVPPRPRPLG